VLNRRDVAAWHQAVVGDKSADDLLLAGEQTRCGRSLDRRSWPTAELHCGALLPLVQASLGAATIPS
jgi:hypothetical protein